VTPEAAVHARLISHPEVAGLVGTRVYPVTLPQTVTLPAVSYLRVLAQHSHTYEGPCDLARARIQIDAWAAAYGQAKAVAEAIRHALAHFQDATVQAALATTERDLYEPDVRTYRVSSDWFVWFSEA
jgi:hypothetical protein